MQRTLIFMMMALLGSGCADKELDAGTEGGFCLPDDSCAAGLVCRSDRCVRQPQDDSGISADDTVPTADTLESPDTHPDAAPLPPLEWATCDTTIWPIGYPKPSFAIQCTQIEVPLDYDHPEGEQLSLRVARHNSKAFPTGKAIFNLAGGPGGTAVGQSGTIHLYMPKLRDSFDLIYVDQRGTGASSPLVCSAGYPETKQQWISCADEHQDKNLNQFLTVNAAHDLEQVRKRLGYDKIYLRGGSYGTRLGLEYIRQHESSVAAIVLDGLAPPDWDFFHGGITQIGKTLDKLVADCASDAACQTVAPDLGADLEARRQLLMDSPRMIKVDGQTYTEDVELFTDLLMAFLDRSESYYRVPRAIHQAVSGNNALWNQLLSEIFGVTVTDGVSDPMLHPEAIKSFRPRLKHRPYHLADVDYVSPGLFITVVCAEWWPNNEGLLALEQLAAAQSWLASSLLGIAGACAAWQVNPIDSTLRQPVVSSVKTLLLSGGIDIRTPPALGDHAVKTLDHGTHLVIPYASHSTISVTCTAEIITQFFEADGDMSAVDTSCIAKVTHPSW